MLKVFNSTAVLYYLTCAVGVVLFICLLAINTHFVIAMLLMAIWIFIAAFVFNYIAGKKVNKITKIMTDDCSVQECVDIYNNLLQRSSPGTKTFLLLNLSVGYLNLGQSRFAKRTLDAINSFPNNRAGVVYKAHYYNNLISYYLQINDIDSADHCVVELKNVLNNSKLYKSVRDTLFHFYTGQTFSINIQKGIYDGAEMIFNLTFERENRKIGKVFAKYTLGKIYLHYNEFDKAIDAFKFVIGNGGDSYYVEESELILSNMNPTK